MARQRGLPIVIGVILVAVSFVIQLINVFNPSQTLDLLWTITHHVGLLFALCTGLGALLLGYPFLTTHTAHLTLPLLGEVHIASAMFFDIGVFAAVVGATLLILTALAHQSLRAQRKPAAEATEVADTAMTGAA